MDVPKGNDGGTRATFSISKVPAETTQEDGTGDNVFALDWVVSPQQAVAMGTDGEDLAARSALC